MKGLVFLSVVVLNLDCVFCMEAPAAWFYGNNQGRVMVLMEEDVTRMEDLQRQITALQEENARLTGMIEDQRAMTLNVQRELDEARRNSKSEIENLMRKHQTEIGKVAETYNQLTADEQEIVAAYTNCPTLKDLKDKKSPSEVVFLAKKKLGMTIQFGNCQKVHQELTRQYNEIMQRQRRQQQIFSDIAKALKTSNNI